LSSSNTCNLKRGSRDRGNAQIVVALFQLGLYNRHFGNQKDRHRNLIFTAKIDRSFSSQDRSNATRFGDLFVAYFQRKIYISVCGQWLSQKFRLGEQLSAAGMDVKVGVGACGKMVRSGALWSMDFKLNH